LGEVAAAGRHLLSLINDILDLAKADAGHLQLSPRRTAVAELVQAATRPAQQVAREAGIDFQVDLPEPLPDVEADPGRLARAVACIVDNAVAFTSAGGTVHVTAVIGEERIRIAVKDSGPGIDPADHERIFAAFEHGGDPGRSGSGIGLALSRRLVELHGGTVTVESRRGSGSEFFIDLPAAPPVQELSVSAISSPTSGAR
jgi:signal transduction histidine kinase